MSWFASILGLVLTLAGAAALAAAEVIQHIGPRPQASLAELAGREGLSL